MTIDYGALEPDSYTPPAPTSTATAPAAPAAPKGGPTAGWYILIACVGGIAFSKVPILGPILLGINSIALLYQLGLLLQGK